MRYTNVRPLPFFMFQSSTSLEHFMTIHQNLLSNRATQTDTGRQTLLIGVFAVWHLKTLMPVLSAR